MRHPLETLSKRQRRRVANTDPQHSSRLRAPLSCDTAPLALLLALFTALSLVATSAAADEATREQMQSLDEQVQEIKSDVLGIAAELDRLEEKLLYPSGSQVAVFVALAPEETLQLDSVEIQIDGEPVARHIYSFKELEALQKGGVQRIHTGNVATGEHQLQVSMAGKLSGGGDFNASESFSFRKEVEPRLLEITLGEGALGGARIQLGAE